MFKSLQVLLIVTGIWKAIGTTTSNEKILANHLLNTQTTHLPARNPEDGQPLQVQLSLYLAAIERFDLRARLWTAQLLFRQEWTDSRLTFNPTPLSPNKFITLTSSKFIWVPDLYFAQELESRTHGTFGPEVLVRIHPDGRVLYSVRLSLLLACPGMDLYRDQFECGIGIESYAYNANDLVLKWKDDPIGVNGGDLFVSPSDYALSGRNGTSCDGVLDSGTAVSCAMATFKFSKSGRCAA